MADEHVPLDYFTANDSPDEGVNSVQTKAKPNKNKLAQERVDYSKFDASDISSLLISRFNLRNPNLSQVERTSVSKINESHCLNPMPKEVSAPQVLIRTVSNLEPIPDAGVRILVLSYSAVRCLEIMKSVDSLRKKNKMVKLFAKHIKLSEQLQILKKNRPQIAFGTPGRVVDLLTVEPSVFKNLSYFFIDVSRDVKLRCIFDIAEIEIPLLKCIFYHLSTHLEEGSLKLGFIN